MEKKTADEIRAAVRGTYGKIAAAEKSGCGCAPGCCSPGASTATPAAALGYSPEDAAAAPAGADLGLGCGNPQAIAALRPGETVLDLGSGGGFDCFLAARAVGPAGAVIGVDMTAAMIERARQNARTAGAANVEFRLGELEHLPVADASVDVIISNCVINLSPEKEQVCREAYRVLKPGGRLAVSDVVATAEMPPELRRDLALHAGCIAGAAAVADLTAMLARAGFTQIAITPREASRRMISEWFPGRDLGRYVVSADIAARKAQPGEK